MFSASDGARKTKSLLLKTYDMKLSKVFYVTSVYIGRVNGIWMGLFFFFFKHHGDVDKRVAFRSGFLEDGSKSILYGTSVCYSLPIRLRRLIDAFFFFITGRSSKLDDVWFIRKSRRGIHSNFIRCKSYTAVYQATASLRIMFIRNIF